MSARDALVERAKKATELSREQLHAYVGANDYLYEQARRGPGSLQNLRNRVSDRADYGVEPLRRTIEAYAPGNIRHTVQQRVEIARERRGKFAGRGEKIVSDWTKALAVQDATSLIKTVRTADSPVDLAKSVRTWFVDFPPAAAPPAPRKSTARKSTARKSTARKSTARKSTARKSTARKSTARKSTAHGTG